ncbi:MAG: alpha/beta hydrolase [Bacteroidota bacterium]
MSETYTSKQTIRGQSVQLSSLTLYYEECGAGKPLVLLHGFGGCTQNWHPFINELSAHFRLILVDMRGHGYSTNPGNEFTHREAAGDVFLLLEELGIERFSAMGMSSGGMTLLHMATAQPERVDALVLISATSYFPDQARVIMRRASFATLPDIVKSMYSECAKRGDEQIKLLIAQFNSLGDNYDDMNFTEQGLSTITARTLVVHGDSDNFFPVEIPISIHRAIPNAELWIIPHGEHVPIYDPKVPFTLKALEFLEKGSVG